MEVIDLTTIEIITFEKQHIFGIGVVPKTETKVAGGRDTRWKVLEGAWIVGTCGLEFWCCTECNRYGTGRVGQGRVCGVSKTELRFVDGWDMQ